MAEKVASNEAVGQFTNMGGSGFGTMAGVGGVVGGIVGDSIQNAFGATPLRSEVRCQVKIIAFVTNVERN